MKGFDGDPTLRPCRRHPSVSARPAPTARSAPAGDQAGASGTRLPWWRVVYLACVFFSLPFPIMSESTGESCTEVSNLALSLHRRRDIKVHGSILAQDHDAVMGRIILFRRYGERSGTLRRTTSCDYGPQCDGLEIHLRLCALSRASHCAHHLNVARLCL